ncbi:response regulator [Synechococcus sp. Nb3U1]|uniref:response regulator n=1 Tax=Synechococcus sp. Nb3U1 TaxID=1914529 RepID=UPI002E1C5D44
MVKRLKITWRSTPYDLLMLDVGLPDQNGIELCRVLRTQGYTQPILLLTAHNHSKTKVEGLDAGADDYLLPGQTL